jgi:hypothetical protein
MRPGPNFPDNSEIALPETGSLPVPRQDILINDRPACPHNLL